MADDPINEREASPKEQSFNKAPSKFTGATWAAIIAGILIIIIGAALIGNLFKSGNNELNSSPANPSSPTTR